MPVSSFDDTPGLEDSLDYHFSDRSLLIHSLTHRSYHHETRGEALDYNERLEFLGDSVLGLVISEALYSETPPLTEAAMSKMKAYLVSRTVLSDIAESLGLGPHLRLGKGEESTGGRQKKSILADALEALIGAVMLDSNYLTARSVTLRLFGERIPLVVTKQEGYDFKSDLQEKCQSLRGTLPDYETVRQEGEEHKKTFTVEVSLLGEVLGIGRGKSKKEAQMAAAREALRRLPE
jgi:ribonuclease-3